MNSSENQTVATLRPYERPEIVLTRRIEAVGTTCNSVLTGGLICRTPGGGCTAVFN